MMKKFFVLMFAVSVLAGCHKDEGITKDNEEEGQVLALDKHFFEVPAEGGTISVTVTGNVKYGVTIPAAFRTWITAVSGTEGHDFTVSENEGLGGREGYVVFSDSLLRDTIYVSQSAKEGILLEKRFFEVSVKGAEIAMKVMSNVTYEVTIPAAFREWIILVPGSRTVTEKSFCFTVSANEDLKEREGYVIFSDGSLCDTAYIRQEAKIFVLDKHRFEVSAAGEPISVEVTSNVEYEVTIPVAFQEWIAATPDSRVVMASRRFAISENDGDVREGHIVFVSGSLKDTVFIHQLSRNFTETLDDLSFDMVYVKGGTFLMGATEEQGEDADGWGEKPVHRVTLSDYYIGKFEVTQGLWEKVMGENPSYFDEGDNYPVVQVSWNNVQDFLAKLNQLTGKRYVLPTEAQWEYAARGGVKSKGYKYSGGNTIDDVAWYGGNSGNKIHPVGTKQPNELGIYDMSGNVCEWCSDWYGDYSSDAVTDPVGPAEGSYRVLRDGCWLYDAMFCRVSYRSCNYPSYRYYDFGFRVVLLP